MERFTVEQLWERVPNKYEAVVVISMEARRLAKKVKEGEQLPEKPLIYAIQRFIEGKVKYTFEES
jgi:DNA-directed RNA polymerase omega subunit